MTIETKQKPEKGTGGLSSYEQETIINFNKEEKVARIFTYEKTWQRHLEKKFGLKPIMDNGFGGKEYIISKDRISMPRAKKVLTEEYKKKLTASLKARRDNAKNKTF